MSDSTPPRIKTIDGVGMEFLRWVRDMIVELRGRVAALEAVSAAKVPDEPTDARSANLSHWIVVAPLRGYECVPCKFDDGTEVRTAREAVDYAMAEWDSSVDWEDGGAVKEGLEVLVFERGSETARFVLSVNSVELESLRTPDWTPEVFPHG